MTRAIRITTTVREKMSAEEEDPSATAWSGHQIEKNINNEKTRNLVMIPQSIRSDPPSSSEVRERPSTCLPKALISSMIL